MQVVNSSVADDLRGLFLASLFEDNTSPTTVNVMCSAVQRHFNKNAKDLDGVELANDLNVVFGHLSHSILPNRKGKGSKVHAVKGEAACRVVVDQIIKQDLAMNYSFLAGGHTSVGHALKALSLFSLSNTNTI